VLYNQL
jgi:hypothetical protein